jgi:nitrogen regulatory protein PII
MEEIEFIINGVKLEALIALLSEYSDNGIFVTQGLGYGRQHGRRAVSDDREGVALLPKVSVRTVVSSDVVDTIIDNAVDRLGGGTFGNGKIFVRPVTGAVRMRTNERGEAPPLSVRITYISGRFPRISAISS